MLVAVGRRGALGTGGGGVYLELGRDRGIWSWGG